MQLTDEQITEFQNLFEKHFGDKISREAAYERGAQLIRLLQIIYKPMTEEEFKRFSR